MIPTSTLASKREKLVFLRNVERVEEREVKTKKTNRIIVLKDIGNHHLLIPGVLTISFVFLETKPFFAGI